MADTIARLNVVCGATDNASGILSGITGKIMALGAAAGIIGGLAFIGKKSLDSFIEFDTAITKSMMMFVDFGDGVRSEVESTSRALSKELGYSASEVADGFYALGSAGISAADSLSMIEDISRFAMASGGELGIAEASETAMTAMKAFKLEADDVPHILDVLAFAGKETNTNLSDLSQAFAYVAPAAGSFGMSVEEVSAALGMMSDVGIKGSAAGTALRRIITNLVAPTGQAAQAIETLNLQVYETGSSGNDLISSIASCQTEMDGYQATINATTAALLGLEDAQRGFNIDYQELQLERMRIEDRAKDENRDYTQAEMDRLGEIEDAQRDLRISMQENSVETLKLQDEQADAQVEIDKLTESIEDQQIQLEEGGGEMRDFADILADIEEAAGDLAPEQRDATLSMLAGVRGISALMSLLDEGGDSYATFVDEAGEADGLVRDMSEFMATSAGVKMDIFRQHIEDLSISLGEKLWPWVEKIIQFFYDNEDTIKSVGNWFLTIASAVASLLTGDWSGFKEKASSAMTTLWQAIRDFDWGGAWDTLVAELSDIASSVWNWITTYDWGGAWDTLISALSGIAKKVYNWIKNYDWANAWDNLISNISGIAKKVYNWIKNYDWANAWDNLISNISGICKYVYDALKAYDWSGAWDSLIDSFDKETFLEKWRNLGEDLMSGWAGGGEWLTEGIIGGLNSVNDTLEGVSDWMGDIDFFEAGRDSARDIKDVGSLWKKEAGEAGGIAGDYAGFEITSRFLQSLAGLVVNIVTILGQGILGMKETVAGFFYEMLFGGWEDFVEKWNNALSSLPLPSFPDFSGSFANIISGIASAAASAWNIFARAYNAIQSKSLGLLPGPLPLWGGSSGGSTGGASGFPSDIWTGGYTPASPSTSRTSVPPQAAQEFGSFASRFGPQPLSDFILSGGHLYKTHSMDTIIGTKKPGSLGGGNTINVSLTFQNVADEQYIHKIGSMVERSLRRVVA